MQRLGLWVNEQFRCVMAADMRCSLMPAATVRTRALFRRLRCMPPFLLSYRSSVWDTGTCWIVLVQLQVPLFVSLSKSVVLQAVGHICGQA